MVQAHPSGGNQLRGPSPAEGKGRRGDCIQAQGGHGVPDGLHLRRRNQQFLPADLRHRQLHPSCAGPLPQEEVPQGRRGHKIGTVLGDQDIPHPLTGDAQGHQTAQDVPVGEGAVRAVEGRPEKSQLIVVLPGPVRQEEEAGTLRVRVAAVKEVSGTDASGVQKALGHDPLPRAEKDRSRGDVPAFRLFVLVQYPRQEQTVLRFLGGLSDYCRFIHVDFVCYTTVRNLRFPSSVPHGFPAL